MKYVSVLLFLQLILALLFGCVSSAGTIGEDPGMDEDESGLIKNFSFEKPGEGKIKGWDMDDGASYVDSGAAVEVPGWESDGMISDSGIEEGWTPTDGNWTAYLKGSDPAVYQITKVTIAKDDTYRLIVDARITSSSDTLKIAIFYVNKGKKVEAVNQECSITDTMQEFSLEFAAADTPESVGKKLGVLFDNISIDESWIGLDNVRLEKIN